MLDERFLVTGSEGCIGSWVVRHLALARVPVVAVDLEPAGRRLAKIMDSADAGSVTFRAGDITAEGLVEELIAEFRITRVVHLAALQVPFVAADPVLGGIVNVVGTLRVFEAVRRARPQVAGLVYASSAAALGGATAEDGVEPLTLYGAFKFCNEESARFYARDYETPSIGLRPCVVYGPARDQGLTAAITHAIKAAVLGIPYEIPFGGALDLQYAEDVARFFVAAAVANQETGAPVFDLHGEAVDTEQAIATIAEFVPGAEKLLSWRSEPIPGRVLVDDAPLLEVLGPIEKVSFREGVRLTADAFAQLRDEGRLSADELPASPVVPSLGSGPSS